MDTGNDAATAIPPRTFLPWLTAALPDAGGADAVGHLAEGDARDATWQLVDVLAGLHDVDAAQIGLADLGRPDVFAARQVQRWRRQWEASKQRELPVIDELATRLERAVPV